MAIIIACTLIIIFASVWIVKQRCQATRRLPLPPGPPGRWLLGNTMPKSYAPFQFARWTEQYGPAFSLKQGHRIFVIIGHHQAAVDIMEKEGANLADRPRSIAAHDAMRYSASVVMSFTYGKITPTSYTDPEVVAINKTLARFHQAIRPGAYLVDTYPILCFVPGYLSQLKAWHKEEHALYNRQLDAVRRQMREGTTRPSFARFILEHQKQYQLEDKDLGYVAGTMFAAGSDTARVQEDLDDIVGRTRLPTFDDQEMLPQVTAFMLESLRWRPVSLGGFAHRATKDIIWKNYLIPAGTTVIWNH